MEGSSPAATSRSTASRSGTNRVPAASLDSAWKTRMTIRERRRELLKGGRLMFQGGGCGAVSGWDGENRHSSPGVWFVQASSGFLLSAPSLGRNGDGRR